jgi:hypothetical protein
VKSTLQNYGFEIDYSPCPLGQELSISRSKIFSRAAKEGYFQQAGQNVAI